MVLISKQDVSVKRGETVVVECEFKGEHRVTKGLIQLSKNAKEKGFLLQDSIYLGDTSISIHLPVVAKWVNHYPRSMYRDIDLSDEKHIESGEELFIIHSFWEAR